MRGEPVRGQLGHSLERFGAKPFVSRIVGVSLVREMGPILTALMIGGRVCIPPRDVRGNASLLVDWLEQEGVTLVHCVPSLFRLLTSEVESRGGGDTVLRSSGSLEHAVVPGAPGNGPAGL